MYDEFEALIAESHSENRRPGVLILKLSAFKNFERKARDIINAYLRKREISDPDRIKIGLPVYDKVRTRIQRPATQIQFSVMPYGYRGFKIKFHDGPSERQAKPKGITCALICCSFSDAPPTGYDINSRIFIATRSPYTLAFPEADRGKAVYIAMCWVNERGELGQWSAFFKVYIP
jgi:hypothetical protein